MLDVIVIGAGLSGLQAALSCQQAGKTVKIIEARDRIGGKIWSVPLASGRGYADLGAAWVNTNTQPRIRSYVERFKLGVVRQRLDGIAVMQVGSDQRVEFPFGIIPEFSTEEKRDLARVRDHIQARSLKAELPRTDDDLISLDRYIRNLSAGPKTIEMVNLWARVMHGLESTEESAAFFLDYCQKNGGLFSIRADDETGGQHLRLQAGAQAIARGIADMVGKDNINLCSPIATIGDHGRYITVTTTAGKMFTARKCIVSIPSTMYKELEFSPTLPARLQQVTDATRLGDYNKAIVCYDKPWWRTKGYNGFFMSYAGPVVVGRDTSVDERRQYSLTCFVNGSPGREWSTMHPHERRATVLNQLAAVFQADTNSEVFRPIEFFEQIWMNEPYSRGALTPVTAIGHLTEYRHIYGAPVGNIHFVGTEYSPEWKGYMEGALCSGEAGGKEVVDALWTSHRASL